MPDAILAAKNVSVSYGSNGTQVRALDDVSLSFATGALTLIQVGLRGLGLSGSRAFSG